MTSVSISMITESGFLDVEDGGGGLEKEEGVVDFGFVEEEEVSAAGF